MIWHLLLPVSKGWGAGTEIRFEMATLKQRIDVINAEGGVVTLDTPISPDGKIPEKVLKALQQLGNGRLLNK